MLERLRARDVEGTVAEYTDYLQKALRNYLRDLQLDASTMAPVKKG